MCMRVRAYKRERARERERKREGERKREKGMIEKESVGESKAEISLPRSHSHLHVRELTCEKKKVKM